VTLLPTEQYFRALFLSGLAGNAGDYRQFLTELAPYLRSFLRRKLPHYHDDVEDIVQEVLLAVHNARHTWRPADPLSAWIHGITRYKLTDFLRSHYRHDALMIPLEQADELFTMAEDDPGHAGRDIGLLLGQLPDKQRLAIQHVKLEGLSVSETATLTGLSESAVKVSIHRGLKALALRLRELL